MNSNLIIYDMNQFLNKYTRFMTKDIYISQKMYTCFLAQYEYLYDILKREQFLYQGHKSYQKIMNIKKNQTKLIRLHNQKYLKKTLMQYESFFDKLYSSDELNHKERSIILCEEEKMLLIQSKNIIPLLVGKLKYLLQCKEYQENQLFVLTDNNHSSEYQKAFAEKNLSIPVQNFKEYGISFLKNDEKLLDHNQKYRILMDYIIESLFPQKDKFHSFYQAFQNQIYLNKDYQDYETFKDYHNYMYKRKFLKTNLSLKKFNEEEIKLRKTFLRSAKNECMPTKAEVDIANFLYYNSITYEYDYHNQIFQIILAEKRNIIHYKKEKYNLEYVENASADSDIYLYSSYVDDKTYLQVLAYELIKRRYPMEKQEDDTIYTMLRETSIENYFSEFINKTLIPAIDYYDHNHTLTKTKLTDFQQQELIKVYTDYIEIIKKQHFISEDIIQARIEQDIISNHYQYLILVGDIQFNITIPYLKIISDYQKIDLVKENIKLLYDYKKYLYENQALPLAHTYIEEQELNILTKAFLKDNLAIINHFLESCPKTIELYLYDDKNRLHIYKNISHLCKNILKKDPKDSLIALEQIKDINILIQDKNFSKLDKNILLTTENKKVNYDEIQKIKKNYDNILLPYVIKDNYHENLLRKESNYPIKVLIYMTLNKCRDKIILLCPKSKKKATLNLLGNLKKITIFE